MNIDSRAVLTGAIAAICIALPAQLVAQTLVATDVLSDTSGVLMIFALLQAVGFLFGGFAAGRHRPESHLSHGALGALAGFLVVEVVALVFTIARGDDVIIPRIVFYAMLAALLGLAGGALSAQRKPAA